MANRKKRPTVMVVDDDPDIVKSIALALGDLCEEFDFQVISCLDGFNAQVSLERLLPEIVILDLMMPKISGFQLLHQLKRSPAGKGKLPIVIIITAINGLQHKKFVERMADEYLVKPFALAILLSKVRDYLKKIPSLERVSNHSLLPKK